MYSISIIGRIILMSSISAKHLFPNLCYYSMTKSGIDVFSKALRMELDSFNIKVSTIEPAGFNTALFQSLQNTFSKSWQNSDKSVKKVYGEDYYYSIDNKFGSLFPASNKLDVVIDDIIDAICNQYPNAVYKPYGSLLERLLYPIYLSIPDYITNKFYNAVVVPKPAYVKNKI